MPRCWNGWPRWPKPGRRPLLLALAPARAALAAAGDDDSARWQWDDLQIAGILSLADALRPESAAVVARLHEMGIRVVMLTGDNERTARGRGPTGRSG